jgi:hypothetical protein
MKGTREGIEKYMRATPIEGSGEEIDVSLLDEEGFLKSNSKSSPETS